MSDSVTCNQFGAAMQTAACSNIYAKLFSQSATNTPNINSRIVLSNFFAWHLHYAVNNSKYVWHCWKWRQQSPSTTKHNSALVHGPLERQLTNYIPFGACQFTGLVGELFGPKLLSFANGNCWVWKRVFRGTPQNASPIRGQRLGCLLSSVLSVLSSPTHRDNFPFECKQRFFRFPCPTFRDAYKTIVDNYTA